MGKDESIISMLLDDTRSKKAEVKDSAVAAMKEKPTALFLRAQRSGALYRDKNFNKAFSTFSLEKAEELQPQVDKASREANEYVGKSVKAEKAYTKDSKQYAQAMIDYYNSQEAEAQLWDQFILALGHKRTTEPRIFSDELRAMSQEGLIKILPFWPRRWFTEMQNGHPPTGDPGKRKNAIGRMQNVLKKKKGDPDPEEKPIGLDDENTPEETLKLRKANRNIVVKPKEEAPKKEEDVLTTAQADLKDAGEAKGSSEPAYEPKPTQAKIDHYEKYTEKGLIKLATEAGLPRIDRNTARKILTDRGVDGYPEPDYTKDFNPKNDKKATKEIPLKVADDDEEENSVIPPNSMLSQITSNNKPDDEATGPTMTHPSIVGNKRLCRICGLPENDPCHIQKP